MTSAPAVHTCSVHVRASFGGDEALRFAAMLVRMYQRWAAREGLPCELDALAGDLDGDSERGREGEVQRATLELRGEGLRERLGGEAGVHRLVRIPPGETRRYTSFVSVAVTAGDEDVDAALAEVGAVQVRSYVLNPAPSVTDNRNGARTEDAQAVLDGDLTIFVPATPRP
ncbi:MAG: PCRF domain-containing protein [Nannocystaceae bacterium]